MTKFQLATQPLPPPWSLEISRHGKMKLGWPKLTSTEPCDQLQLMVTKHFFIRCSNSQVTFEDFSVDFTEEEWGPLDPAHRKLHRAEMPQPYSHLVSMEDLNENSVDNLQEKGLGDLLHEELFCWLILEEMASTITGSKDYIVNLHGEMYRRPELDLSLCQKWGEASSHVSSNKSSG
ncbi:Zinc finger protein 806 [Myotis brandtii]|uniref:Zinc finger protein 806 n=1 Tax=Myotis brandtii TaxID=109478 RepID=S7MBH0_MYOBR|nr:Zinc finger protein 806 [Myotis brandtii]